MTELLVRVSAVFLLLAVNPASQTQFAPQAVVMQQRITLGIGGAIVAGFSEVSGLTTEPNVAEYRAGSEQTAPHKVTGINKVTDITLKRGVVPDSSLYDWLHSMTSKDIVLKVAPLSGPAQSFHLRNCKPVKYTGPPSGQGRPTGPIAIEELVLSCESIAIEK